MESVLDNIRTENLSFSGCDMVASITMPVPGGSTITKVIGSLQTLTYSIHMDKRPVRSLGNINAKSYVFGPRTIAGTLIFTVFNKHFTHEIFDDLRKQDPEKYGNYNFIADEMPPFNITISFVNEYGAMARMAIYGVRIMNEGKTLSINDIYTENTYQYVATDIDYMTDDLTVDVSIPEVKTQPATQPSSLKIVAKEIESISFDDEMIRIREYLTERRPDAIIEWIPENTVAFAPNGYSSFSSGGIVLQVIIGEPLVRVYDFRDGFSTYKQEVTTELKHFPEENVFRTMAPRSFIDSIFGL